MRDPRPEVTRPSSTICMTHTKSVARAFDCGAGQFRRCSSGLEGEVRLHQGTYTNFPRWPRTDRCIMDFGLPWRRRRCGKVPAQQFLELLPGVPLPVQAAIHFQVLPAKLAPPGADLEDADPRPTSCAM